MNGIMVTMSPGDQGVSVESIEGGLGLERLVDALGGWIELIPGFTTVAGMSGVRKCVAFCDEEGKLKGLDVNWGATVLWKAALDRGAWGDDGAGAKGVMGEDVLVGPVVIIWGDDELLGSL